MLRSRWSLVGVVLLCAATLLLPGCAYIARQASGQFQLIAGRMPIERALDEVDFTDREREMLLWVPRIKEYGEAELGLLPTKNYTTINPDFDDVVWNVSAAAPDAFTSHVYRYPVVGELPYIGFFDKDDARAEAARLRELGWVTWIRSAGAYSTLGWFRDPLWRSMLRWDEERMSNTVLHELAHATLWLKGQGRFNESWASFVGDEASERFLRSIADEHPEIWQKYVDREHDSDLYRQFMHGMVQRLDGLYRSGLPREEIVGRMEAVIADSRADYATIAFRIEGYRHALDEGRTLNTARLKQFRVYNTGMDDFDEALVRFEGDLAAFVTACREELPKQRRRRGRAFDPYEALRQLEP